MRLPTRHSCRPLPASEPAARAATPDPNGRVSAYAGRVQIVEDLKYWTDHVVGWGLFALWVWALLDCAVRKAAAFPACDKLTKPAWLTILVLSALIGALVVQPFAYWVNPTQIVGLVATVVAGVYLADVRPAVREITGDSGR